jgi:hypothetical protein
MSRSRRRPPGGTGPTPFHLSDSDLDSEGASRRYPFGENIRLAQRIQLLTDVVICDFDRGVSGQIFECSIANSSTGKAQPLFETIHHRISISSVSDRDFDAAALWSIDR